MEYSKTQQSAIKEVLTIVLSQERPEEVLLVEGAFTRPPNVQRKRDGLGFGDQVQVVLWMLPLLHVLGELASTAAKGFAEKWGEHLFEWWKKPSSDHLDAAALDKLRVALITELSAAGVSNTNAYKTSNSVVALLVSRPELLRGLVEHR